MEEKEVKKEIPDILTLVNKEKFRRKVVIYTKLIAVGLILAIIWFGWVNYSYAKEINSYMSEYGPLAHCYLCGLENYKKCDCQYNNDMYSDKKINLTQLGEDLGYWNIQGCGLFKDLAPQNNPLANINIKK